MDIKIFEECLNEFMLDQDTRVILVKGAWGIGKTYSINNYLKEKKSIKVSLFGINNIDDLIRELTEKAFTQKFKKSRIKEKVTALKPILSIPLISKILPKDAIDITKSNLSLENTTIFFDDLERSTICKKDLFGYIDKLKNSTLSTIIIAVNDGELKEIDDLKEKVVDKEIRLENTHHQIIKNIYGDDERIASEVFNRLEVRNLRVIKKAKLMMDKLLDESEGLNDYNITLLKYSTLVKYATSKTKINEKNEKLKKIPFYDEHFTLNKTIDHFIDSQIIKKDLFKNEILTLINTQIKEDVSKLINQIEETVEDSFTDNIEVLEKNLVKAIKNKNIEKSQLIYCVRILYITNQKKALELEKFWLNKDFDKSYYSRIKDFIDDEETLCTIDKIIDKLSTKEKESNNSSNNNCKAKLYLTKAHFFSFNNIKDEFSEITKDEWIDFFKSEDSMDLLKSHSDNLRAFLSTEVGRNLKSSIEEMSKIPIHNYRFKFVLYF